jgi:hypothetical protein
LYLDAGDTEEIFDRLNRLAASKEDELDSLKARSRDLELKFSRKLEKLDQERVRMQTELREASREIMRQWREGQRGRKEALKELAQLRDSVGQPLGTEETQHKLSIEAIAQGQVLLYLPWNKTGLVQEVDGKKERVRLDMGGVSLWVGLADVQSATRDKSDSGKVVVRSAPAPVTRYVLICVECAPTRRNPSCPFSGQGAAHRTDRSGDRARHGHRSHAPGRA